MRIAFLWLCLAKPWLLLFCSTEEGMNEQCSCLQHNPSCHPSCGWDCAEISSQGCSYSWLHHVFWLEGADLLKVPGRVTDRRAAGFCQGMKDCVKTGSYKVILGTGTHLVVKSKVTPSPSAYRLTSKDDEDLEMCLITDYSPDNVNFYSAEKPTSAVVEVATAENTVEPSYLSTYWARRDEMQCGASHKGFGDLEGEDPESGASTVCVTGLSSHFRTDEHLNTLSLSQLGLKTILVKGIIFNVLMTMLLWKKKD